MKERLQKILSSRGIASRRAAEEMILAGRVKLNGEVIYELGVKADPDSDSIRVDGKNLPRQRSTKLIALNKPEGYLCTKAVSRERGPTVYDLIPHDRSYVSIGRLDRDSSGLLLFTDNGDVAFRLSHPSFETPKVYHVVTRPALTMQQCRMLQEGVQLDDGTAQARKVRFLRGSEIEIVLTEGRKRQIRRMISAVGSSVLRLHRVSVGGLSIGRLSPGQWRELTKLEVSRLVGVSTYQHGEEDVSRR